MRYLIFGICIVMMSSSVLALDKKETIRLKLMNSKLIKNAIEITIYNTSEKEIQVNGAFDIAFIESIHGEIKFSAFDSEGKKLEGDPSFNPRISFSSDDLVTLKPGSFVGKIIEIGPEFRLRYGLAKGKFALSAYYSFVNKRYPQAYGLSVESNTIELKIE